MSRREWRSVLLLALILVAVTSIPYLIAWANAASSQSQPQGGWEFTGFLFGVEDGNSYLGKMRLGAQGAWDFSLFYTPEAHDGVPLVFLPYILPGQLVGRLLSANDPALTPALIGTFHLMRVIFSTLMIVVIYRFCAAFLSEPRDRLTATLLAALGGGLGWALALGGQSALPAEFYIPEGFSFLILFGLPHLALARAALLLGLLALMKTLAGTDTPQKLTRVSGKDRRWLLLAAGCWLVVGLSVPFYLVIIYCILGAWGLAAWLKTRRFPLALFIRAVIAAGLTFPLFLFYAAAFARNPAFAAWSAQNLLPSPAPLQYVWAYLPLALLALFGARRLWQQPGHPSALLLGWVVIVPILVYLPINVQRRMSEAVIVPLAILAAAGVRALAKRGLPRWAGGALIAVCCFSSAFLLLGGVLAAKPAYPLFRPTEEIAALNWLNQHSQPGSVVLSAFGTGNLLPAWTHLRPYIGHGPESIDGELKIARTQAFYGETLSAAERAGFFAMPCAQGFACVGAIRYVMFGPLERALAPNDTPEWAAGLTIIYDENGYRIYATSP